MEHQALSHISKSVLFVLLVGFITNCSFLEEPASKVPQVYIRANDALLKQKGGILYYDSTPFSGKVFQTGTNKDTLLLFSYIEGKMEGNTYEWYENSHQQKEIRNYTHGKMVGSHCGWWPDGHLRFLFNYENGVYEGKQQEWNESGRLFREANYHVGQEAGLQKYWRPNGALYANYFVKNGRNYGLTGVKNCVNVADSIQ